MTDMPIQTVFPQGDKIWDSQLLDEMRCEGDPPADDTVDAILRANEGDPEQTARVLLRQLLGGGHYNVLMGTPGTELLGEFLREQSRLPPWADPARIELAQALGRRHTVVGSVLLAVAALPECYLDARGAPVLTATGQLSEQPTRRLRHTSHMVFSVCAPGSVVPAPGAPPDAVPRGLSKAITVRLMHALIRRFVVEDYRLPETFYTSVERELGMDPVSFGDEDKTPVPINQEDQAFVLLTFSYVVLRGLERMGIEVPPHERDAYVHLWNVVGHAMGVRRELMADDYVESASLFHALKQRLAGPSPEGQALMAAMLTWINKLVPRPLRKLDLGAELVIHFVGRESAAMLGIEQRGLRWLRHRAFTLPVDGFEALKPAGMQWNPLAMLMQRLAGPMVRRFMAEASTERPPPPGHLPTPRPAMEPWPEYVVQSVSA
ncbi:MAG: DUF2236 domain-containing protein, partial [Myxococcales bacterium]|nr:DUF2236 domain-containing protein [Myxococcales bacterium]